MADPMYGFIRNSIILRERITLAVEMGTPPLVAHRYMEFLEVNHRSTYPGVLGRPTLKKLWVVTSIHHLCMKFPTEQCIAMIWGHQMGSRECYLNFLRKSEPRIMNVIITGIEMIVVPE